MNHLSDIEEEGAIDDSFRLGDTNHTRHTICSEDRTSKSGNMMFSVDESILELIAATDDDYDDTDDRHRDPLLGACCDLVRAVVVTDIFYIIQSINMMITIVLGLSVTDPDDYNLRVYDDDRITATVNQLDQLFWILIIKNMCGVLFASIGIYGATRFNKYLVLITAIFCVIDILWCLMFARWMSAGLCLIFIYPHIALFMALHKATITRENYVGMRHCCCVCCINEIRAPEPQASRGQSSGDSTEKSCGASSDCKDSRLPSTAADSSCPDEANSVTAKSA
eukprot:CAMPEP_0116150380 /NCGR_PEP_ID=MMETSP0329-20121206/19509_1 /TAXON_ID=697910 /ORGANISM="Pseudo-nitzschia arenysensis, Strain B593" /LENGTH=280 /DNA_ID=CAMNT_0003646875 /DNA_START=54 /DNA_END=896 /DNA_ORIENTATION=+